MEKRHTYVLDKDLVDQYKKAVKAKGYPSVTFSLDQHMRAVVNKYESKQKRKY